jgi:carboxylesterase
MPAALLEGAEPFAASNGPEGVLVLHGFTGSPNSLRSLAEVFANDGFTVELPLLDGHGTSPTDLAKCRFSDWTATVDAAYESLAARCDHTVVVGLSMGGTLACWLGERHNDIAGIVLINPFVDPPAPEFIETMRAALDAGVAELPSIGSDIAKPGMNGGGYDATPIAPMLSLLEGVGQVSDRLGEVVSPVLLLSSRVDHVVPVSSGDVVERGVSGPVERVFLERSYHVATLDYDAQEIEDRSVAFARKVVAG